MKCSLHPFLAVLPKQSGGEKKSVICSVLWGKGAFYKTAPNS